jgi:23S rRNA (cytosine1962-C5)-methyltransferase
MARSPRLDAPKRAPGRRVVLRAGREKPVLNRHPWVFSGAIASIGDDIADGDIADVVRSDGEFLARGYVNRRSQIVTRLLTFTDEPIDDAFFARRLATAIAARSPGPTRLVNAESDGLPGLIVDRYADFAVLQASTLGMDRLKRELAKRIAELAGVRGVYDRSDVDGRDKEALSPETGTLFGDDPPELVAIDEATASGSSVRLGVDVKRGHKTGTYLDQSENRKIVGRASSGGEVLNLFSFAGSFALHAVASGATKVVNVDSSADALALSERNANENGFSDRIEHVRADAFEALRRFRDEGRTFDGVVLDPPKFAHSSAQVDRAARAYKDLNRVALALVRPTGFLATFSCSGLVSTDLFQKIVFSASVEAKRDAQIVRRLTQAPDHPVLLSFPEGEYLKGLLLRVE